MSATFDDAVLGLLAEGKGRTAIGKALTLCQPELSTIIWRLRAGELVEFDSDKLTRKGALQVGHARLCAAAEDNQPDTPGASGTARKAPGAASSGAARRDTVSAPTESGQDAPYSQRSGRTHTRRPGDVIRRIGREIDLEDPRKALATMIQLWPEAARRLQQLAADRQTSLEALIAQALAAGIEIIEKEGAA